MLVGLPGAGKSTVGPLLAARLGRPFHDLDAEIVRREGRSIATVFAEGGEPAFREVEAAMTRELFAGPPSVIAAGGGWVVTDANLAAASQAAVIVHLSVTPATAAARLGRESSNRPLLSTADVQVRLTELEAQRGERYARADVEVNTETLGTEEVVVLIASLIGRSA